MASTLMPTPPTAAAMRTPVPVRTPMPLSMSMPSPARDAAPGAEPEAAAPDAAFARWCDEAWPRVLACARAQSADREVAAEVAAQAFLKACRAPSRVPAGEAGVAWLCRAAYTTSIDHWRRRARRAEVSVAWQEFARLPDRRPRPDEICLSRERARRVRHAVAGLRIVDRRILALKFAGGLTDREIGRRLRLSPGAVTMRLWRALRRLRGRLPDLA